MGAEHAEERPVGDAAPPLVRGMPEPAGIEGELEPWRRNVGGGAVDEAACPRGVAAAVAEARLVRGDPVHAAVAGHDCVDDEVREIEQREREPRLLPVDDGEAASPPGGRSRA